MGTRLAVFLGLMLVQGICNANPDVIWSNCYDMTGRPVVYVDDPGSNRLEATFHDETPTVIWDSRFAKQLSTDAQTFLYAHACAHHSLGHTYSLVPENGEERADCWAANTLINVGIFIEDDLARIEDELNALPKIQRKAQVLKRDISLRKCLNLNDSSPLSNETTYSEFEPNCRQVMMEEEYEEIETISRPEQVPCEHCNCPRWGENEGHPYSDCPCLHDFDTINVTVEIRVPKIRFIPKEVCGEKLDTEDL